jgi:hypothetical protein
MRGNSFLKKLKDDNEKKEKKSRIPIIGVTFG